MPPLSCSTSWNASRHKEGEPMLAEIRSLGFTHAEISHGLRFSRWPGVQAAVAQGVIKISSLHNFCPHPVEFSSASPNCCQFSDDRLSQRQAAIRHTFLTIENAASLQASVVVLHLGWVGPRSVDAELERWYRQGRLLNREFVQKKIAAVRERQKVVGPVVKRVRECLDKIVEFAAQHRVRLGFENREDYAEFPDEWEMDDLLRAYPAETVGYWHDFAHSARKHCLFWQTELDTLQRKRSRLIGCHVQDFTAPHQDHLPLGKGQLDFPALLRDFPMDYLAVLELSPEAEPAEIIESQRLWNSYERT